MIIDPQVAAAEDSLGLRTERRIGGLTLLIGALAAAVAALLHRFPWAAGLLIGTALAWLNFRWLGQGLDALVAAATAQSGVPKPRVPIGVYLRAMLRYALIGFTVYVIFEFLKVPLASMIFGLCALGAAVIAASLYEVVRPVEMGPFK